MLGVYQQMEGVAALPRQARVKDRYGVYHIYQRSQAEREIFRDESDRSLFWDVLKDASKQFPFRLLGYCMLDPGSYHLLLKLDGCDISSLMKSINISYVRGIGVSAGLFRDRYHSDLISTRNDLTLFYDQLRQRSEGRLRWNSFCHFDRLALEEAGMQLADVRDIEPAASLPAACEGDSCISLEVDVRRFLDHELEKTGTTFDEMLLSPALRNRLISDVRSRSTLSLKQIGGCFGNLSESAVSKILKTATADRQSSIR